MQHHNPFRSWISNTILAVLLFCLSSSAAELTTTGHFDLNIGFTNGIGWQFDLFNFADNSRSSSRERDLGVTEAGKLTVPAGDTWTPIGAIPGSPFWLMPQAQAEGILLLGYRTEDIDPNPFLPIFGNPFISLEMIDARGSGMDRGGEFSMYQTDAFGEPNFQFTTADGIGNNDIRNPIPVPAHAHFNWTFTEPGEYQVTFRTTATMTEPPFNGVLTNGTGTYTFFVLGAPNLHVYDQGDVELRANFSSGQWQPVTLGNESLGMVPVGVSMIYASPNSKSALPSDPQFSSLGSPGSDFWVLPQSVTDVPSIGVVTLDIPSGAFDQDVILLELHGMKGPDGGHFTIFRTDVFGDHTMLVNSADGLDSAVDVLPLGPGAHRHRNWGFTRPGVYELSFTLAGTPTGQSTVVRSAPFTLRIGVETFPGFRDRDANGLDDHWEARHGFTSPADPTADPDMDHRSNLREFLHDTFHDLPDADVTRLNLAKVDEGRVDLSFNTLEGRMYRVFFSDDLIEWRPASSKILGSRLPFSMSDDGSGPTQTPPTRSRFYRLDVTFPGN